MFTVSFFYFYLWHWRKMEWWGLIGIFSRTKRKPFDYYYEQVVRMSGDYSWGGLKCSNLLGLCSETINEWPWLDWILSTILVVDLKPLQKLVTHINYVYIYIYNFYDIGHRSKTGAEVGNSYKLCRYIYRYMYILIWPGKEKGL